MVNLLIGNKNSTELDILYQQLTNDKNYRVERATTGKETIQTYLTINPDVLILDNSLTDMTIENIVTRLSANPIEKKKCNIILTLPFDYTIKLNDYTKINKIIYKPFELKQLDFMINEIALDYNTPDLEVGEIDWLLESLNFNCVSGGYNYMKKAIIYCYYRPEKLSKLDNILNYLSYEFNTNKSQVRDSLNGCIRPFNNSNECDCSDELFKILYNYGHKLSLKDFLDRIVSYLIKIKKKGRLF